jgi:hypothetical protein
LTKKEEELLSKFIREHKAKRLNKLSAKKTGSKKTTLKARKKATVKKAG